MKTSLTISDQSIQRTPIQDLFVIHPKKISEGRGGIREMYRQSTQNNSILPDLTWKQINLTESNHGVIRGIHAEEMNKLVSVASGEVFGAYVDLREDSPSFGQHFTIHLTVGTQVFVPQGVGNGFQSISETPSQYLYFFDQEWTANIPGKAITPLDSDISIQWPISIDTSIRNILSEKDFKAPTFRKLFPHQKVFQ
jgi:dTDP-4-dehydrorhamnose 3,5-epimerase